MGNERNFDLRRKIRKREGERDAKHLFRILAEMGGEDHANEKMKELGFDVEEVEDEKIN